jgi:pyruvate/2-oxoglutarate dehydrogenase complex dihydrolipoamide acyltransferase (E2) component
VSGELVEVTLPKFGWTMTSATVAGWLKSVGDRVEEGESLYSVVTEKVDVEVASPVSGILKEIVALEGAEVPVGGLVARIDEST